VWLLPTGFYPLGLGLAMVMSLKAQKIRIKRYLAMKAIKFLVYVQGKRQRAAALRASGRKPTNYPEIEPTWSPESDWDEFSPEF
jgi:hypothetical protein